MLYDIEVRIDNEYFSDGIIDFNTENNTFEGYLTDDYIIGKYENKILSIELFRRMLNTEKNFYILGKFYIEVIAFESLKANLEMPGEFTLYCHQKGKILEVFFICEEENITEEEFENELNKILDFFY